MSLSSLVTATETAVRMSESAVLAAEEAMAAARLASIHANSALAAARLALDLERSLRREGSGPAALEQRQTETKINSETVSQVNTQVVAASPDRRLSTPELEDAETVEQLLNNDLESEGTEEREEGETGSKKKKNCRNCKMYKWGCLNGKFVLKVMKKTIGMKVVGWGGPPDLVGRVGTVVGGGKGEVSISWNSKHTSSYSLLHEGEHAFKFFCLESEPTPPIDDESLELESDVSEYDRKLFVGGLDHSVTDQYLREYFETYGALSDWVVMKTPQTKLSRGFYFFVVFLSLFSLF